MMRSSLLHLALWATLALGVMAQPRHLYLTWDNPDTAHTQTVVFQTTAKALHPRVEVELDGPSGTVTTLAAKTTMLVGPGRRTHWVTLKDLTPSTKYRFRAGDSTFGMSPWRSFRTLPDDRTPIKVAAGGDMYRHPETVELLQAAASHKPDVALIGGDIAYADNDLKKIGFWDDWLDNWADFMDPKDGPMVGMILAIGNHEVGGAFDQDKQKAPFYFGFFPQGGEAYFTRQLNSEVEVVVLDSSHVTSHQSQVPFLTAALQSMTERAVPYKLALYHVPCYPSHRSYDDRYCARGRKYWVPVFDKYGLDIGLENHDHAFKRTHPLKAGKIDQGGTVYLGDGCWGRTPRSVDKQRWYQAKVSSTYHVWMLSTGVEGMLCEAIGRNGEVFDRTTRRAH